MIEDVLHDAEEGMKKSVEAYRRELGSVRAGRANPSLLDRIVVEYYGSPTPLAQVASINVPEPRLLTIQPWDRSMLGPIEKAIMKSDLGITPNSDGILIRLAMPPLNEDRRRELVKSVKKMEETQKVALRNQRRDAMEILKDMVKEKEISEDEGKRAQDSMQKLTDRYTQELEKLTAQKEKEILEV